MSTSRASGLSSNQMRTITTMDKGVIEDYYHMTNLDENVNWMNQHTHYKKYL